MYLINLTATGILTLSLLPVETAFPSLPFLHSTFISQNEGIKNGNGFGNYFTFFFMLQ